MYDSPIHTIVHTTDRNLGLEMDNMVMQKTVELGIDIDKDKLVAALTQDKERYEDAYQRGYRQAEKDRKIKVLVEKSSSLIYRDIREYDGLEECLDDIFKNWENKKFYPEVVVSKPDPRVYSNEITETCNYIVEIYDTWRE